jgi:hypothetical protein
MAFAHTRRLRRTLTAALLISAALLSPGGALAQSLDPGLLVSPYDSPDAHILNASDSFITFGDGELGHRPPIGDSTSASYRSGEGAAGYVPSAWSSDDFSCLFWNC